MITKDYNHEVIALEFERNLKKLMIRKNEEVDFNTISIEAGLLGLIINKLLLFDAKYTRQFVFLLAKYGLAEEQFNFSITEIINMIGKNRSIELFNSILNLINDIK